MHVFILDVGEKIKKKIIGHYTYYGINGNFSQIMEFYLYIKDEWYRVLRKRGQKNKIKYEDYDRIWKYLKIPLPSIYVNIWS